MNEKSPISIFLVSISPNSANGSDLSLVFVSASASTGTTLFSFLVSTGFVGVYSLISLIGSTLVTIVGSSSDSTLTLSASFFVYTVLSVSTTSSIFLVSLTIVGVDSLASEVYGSTTVSVLGTSEEVDTFLLA
jgi:hypothetical protein